MSWAFIAAIRQNPHQTYVQLLNNIRDVLATKYTQKPQLSCSHPLGRSFEVPYTQHLREDMLLLTESSRYEPPLCNVKQVTDSGETALMIVGSRKTSSLSMTLCVSGLMLNEIVRHMFTCPLLNVNMARPARKSFWSISSDTWNSGFMLYNCDDTGLLHGLIMRRECTVNYQVPLVAYNGRHIHVYRTSLR
jgi:hypothetical protein